jgi:PKD repeat protein
VHSYAAAGTYTVTLTATGACGDDTFSAAVAVATPPPQWKIYLPVVFK